LRRALFLACLALGCARPPAPGARQLIDGLGRTVRVGAVRRVVSLAPSSTEIVYAVGAGPLVVGVDRYSDWPPEARALPRVGADVDPSLERIVSLRPDLVLTATSANAQATVEALERAGVPVFVSRADRLDEIYRDVEAIGDAVGRRAAARELAGRLRARVDAVRTAAAGRARVRALVVVWSQPLVVAGPRSHVGDLIAAAGGENTVDDSQQPFPTYSVERILERSPEVVVVGTHADATPPLAPLERLATLPAVRDHRLFTVDGDLLYRPGPRVADGAEALARLFATDEPRKDHAARDR
jgi:iron complex transport system substrate-binding protein